MNLSGKASCVRSSELGGIKKSMYQWTAMPDTYLFASLGAWANTLYFNFNKQTYRYGLFMFSIFFLFTRWGHSGKKRRWSSRIIIFTSPNPFDSNVGPRFCVTKILINDTNSKILKDLKNKHPLVELVSCTLFERYPFPQKSKERKILLLRFSVNADTEPSSHLCQVLLIIYHIQNMYHSSIHLPYRPTRLDK